MGKDTVCWINFDRQAAYNAYKKYIKYNGGPETGHISGYWQYTPEQVFYISYGTSMCTAATKEFMVDLVKDADVTPAVFRVNTVLGNDSEFSKVFNCPAGSKMNAANKVQIW